MFKRESSLPVEAIHTGPSQRAIAVGSRARVGFTLARCGLTSLLVALASSAGGCSDSLECKPSIPEGAVYKATVLVETANSDGCYIVNAARMSPFTLTVGKTEPTASRPDCSVTPAAGPPEQIDIRILGCVPSETEMLGVRCEIEYDGGCRGHMQFYFSAPAGVNVNWGAPVIDGLLFRVQDSSPGCISNHNDCLDEYTARLERIR